MKRNLCLIQKVLEHVEAQDSTADCRPPEVAHFSAEEVCYHAKLCFEAGYLARFREVPKGDGANRVLICLLGPLTWAGHNVLIDFRSNPPD